MTAYAYEAASSEFAAEVNERAALSTVLAIGLKVRSLTQPAPSELTGMQQAEISRIERGAGYLTFATLLWLADALGRKLAVVPTKHDSRRGTVSRMPVVADHGCGVCFYTT